MTWKHWALAAAGVFVLSIDGWGCGGSAEQIDHCGPNEMTGDSPNGYGWIHWDDVPDSESRQTQCFYTAPNGSQWAGGSSTSKQEPVWCWLSDGASEARLQVFGDRLLFVDSKGQTAQLGVCP